MKPEQRTGWKRNHCVLPTETAEEFESDYRAFERVLKPRDRIEQMHVEDLAYHNWKVAQRRRVVSAIFKEALNEGLYALLCRLDLADGEAATLVKRWMMGDAGAGADVIQILEAHGLNEGAIEAEAFARCSNRLTAVEQSEALHAARRDKAIPNLAFYREMLTRDRQRDVNSPLNNDAPMRIEHAESQEDSRGH